MHGLGGRQRIAAGRQLDADTHGILAVQAGGGRVGLAADLDGGHVLEAHGGAIGIGAQHDVLELADRRQLAHHRHRGGDLLARDVGQVADGAAGHLGVLAADGGCHVLGRELVALQLGGIEPDAHRLFRAEQLCLAYAGHTLDFGHDIARGIVAQGHRVIGLGVLGRQHDEQQEVGRRLVHAHALLRHGRRQARRGARQAVLHVHLRQIHVGAGLEADGDAARAIGLGHRLHVDQTGRAVHLALDHGQHAVFEHLRGRAWIGGVDDDGRRSHLGVLSDRKLGQRNTTEDDDE